MKNQVITDHKLDFKCSEWDLDPSVMLFRIGTCHGQWYCKDRTFVILSVINDVPHNGHLNDVFQWFEHSAKRDGYKLMVQHIWNKRFKKHLIEKRGFIEHLEDSAIKHI